MNQIDLIGKMLNNHAKVANKPEKTPLETLTEQVAKDVKDVPLVNPSKIEQFEGRLTDVESQISELRVWKDPRNTPGKIDRINERIDMLENTINELVSKFKQLEGALNAEKPIETIPESQASEEVKSKRGRPRKDADKID